jgi:hemoglobin/transferrin/lactoferrin receptor protein
MLFYKHFLGAAALIFFTSLTLAAQIPARISGIVRDQSGAVIPGATVTLKSAQAPAKTAATDKNGEYFFTGLAAGEYEVKVAAKGFAEQARRLRIGTGEQNVDFDLSTESLNVVVTAEINQKVELKNATQNVSVVDSAEIQQRASTIIAQAAQEEAGVNLQRTSPTMGSVFVRGLVGGKVNVFVDGVRYTTGAQRGGVSTFFNLNDPTGVQSIEIVRGSTSAQFGSDGLGGSVGIITRNPPLGDKKPEFHGDLSANFNSADRGAGASLLFSYGTNKLGGYVNLAGRYVENLRAAQGLDSHAAVTRFLGLPSSIIDDRLPGTAFKQFGGAARLNYTPSGDSQLILHYSRNQQDGGKRYDQMLGGDGNLIADLRNLMLDFGYARFVKQNLGFFDNASFAVSLNQQREERVNQGGQGDPFGNITHQYEKTSAYGFNFFLGKELPNRHSLVIGGDIYREKVNSPASTLNPRNNVVVLSRPRVPDEAGYTLGGVYAQDSWQAIPNRLRVSGALRLNGSKYTARAADSPVVNGFRLWGDDDLSASDVSGRIGAVIRLYKEFRLAASYSRGFKAPNITESGTLGLTGDGFETDFQSAGALGGLIGTTAGTDAVSTGLAVAKQRSELTDSYDLSFRYSNKRFDTEATVFFTNFKDAITKQALILPTGAVGRFLGDQQIISQSANGAVFVALSTAPVLVRANYTGAKIYGFEYEAEAKLTRDLKFTGNYTYIYSKDAATGLPPNIEGGTPPPNGFVSFKYERAGLPFWVELFSTLASKQNRLSSLDLNDRRTGATRSRAQIANFFRRGACVLGLTNNPNGICGSGDETILLRTGETIAQVQNRLLGAANSAPLLTYLPSYAIVNMRGGFRFCEKSTVFLAFENMFDRPYRNPSWGIDGAGRSFRVGYRYRF